MKKILSLLLIIALVSGCTTAKKIEKLEAQTKALEILEAFKTQQFETIYNQLSSTLQKQVTKEQFEAGFKQLTAMYQGEPVSDPTLMDEKLADSYQVSFAVHYPLMETRLKLVLNNQYRLESITVSPALTIKNSKFKQVTLKYNDLSAVMMVPEQDTYDMVILVPGSGPTDKDETIGPNKPFFELAEALAAQGIASVRFDKRSLIALETLDDASVTVNEEFVYDAVAIYDSVKQLSKVNKIYFIGHSLGAMLMGRIASQTQADGYIMIGTPAIKLQELMLKQYRYLLPLQIKDQTQVNQQLAYIEQTVAAINKLTPTSATPAKLMFNINMYYWLDLNAYDQVAATCAITKPVLMIQGAADYQVPPDQITEFQKACTTSNITYKIYDKMNHIMATNGPGPEAYFQVSPIDQTMVNDIITFIKENN